MELKLWKNFKKRINSTKQPADADAIVMDVVFKSDTSIENPVLLIEGIDLDYNYCKLGSHYYYINDIVIINNSMYELHCIQDLMATYKADVLALQAYIQYASYGASEAIPFNDKLYDDRIALNVDKRWSVATGEGEIFTKTELYYAVTVASKSVTGRGTSEVYILNSVAMASFANYLFNGVFNEQADVVEQLVKEFNNIYAAVLSLRAMPMNTTLVNSISSQAVLILGGVSTGVACRLVRDDVNVVELEQIPLNWPYNDWRKQNVDLSIYLPLVGIISLSTGDFLNANYVTVKYVISPTSGIITYYINAVTADASYLVAIYEGEFGYSLPLSSTPTNMLGAIGDITSGAIGAHITGNMIPAATSIISAIPKAFSHSLTTIGGSGNSSKLAGDNVIRLFMEYTPTSIEPESIRSIAGLPIQRVDYIGNFVGYCECRQASVNIDGLGSDKDAINSIINSGFYIE